MDQDIPHNEIIIEVRGNVGVVTLNRPQSLNALSLDMIREIASALNKWKDDKGVHAVACLYFVKDCDAKLRDANRLRR